MKIFLKKFNEKAVAPTKAHPSDACFDVVATSIEDLGDGRIVYGLGFGLEPEFRGVGLQFDFRARSSIHKTGLILANGIGTGDEGYTGEYKLVFYNVLPELPNYEVGDRIAQMQVMQSEPVIGFDVVEELNDSSRGSRGFGSSGRQ